MNADIIREYALSKPDAEESFPFGEGTLVFKINRKIFLLLSLDADPLRFNVKCDPEKALQLREEHPDTVMPGWHMNKKHWNTVLVDGSLPLRLLKEFIDDSYALVKK
jgi:predicted DNA-binding protein (MmcQ/YjbR family)